jgi:hypothetical protein
MTHNLVDYCTYVVRKSEEKKYLHAGVNVLAVEDDLITGIPAVQNWLIDNAKEEVICIIDDDVRNFIYRIEKVEKLEAENKEIITAEIERLSQICYDLEIGHIVFTAKVDPKTYVREFSFFGLPFAVKIINRIKCKSRFCDIDFLNDSDFQLQELLRNRICLMPEYFTAIADLDTNSGGSNDAKSADKFFIANDQMKMKWGKYYVPAGTKAKAGRINVKR